MVRCRVAAESVLESGVFSAEHALNLMARLKAATATGIGAKQLALSGRYWNR